MAKDRYVGVVPPIVTPVDEFERVDEAALRGIVRRCKDVGLHGVFVAGSNGECMALTQAERNRAIRIVLDEAGPDYPVMSGVMDSSTQRVIDNIKALEDMGGDVAVVTPVFYARHATQDETVRHFEEILRHTKVKLMIYNIPMFTGLNLTPETIIRIAELDSRVIGCKDTSGNFSGFQKLLRHFKDSDFILHQGSTNLAAASMLLGADGFVPSLAPVFPKVHLKVYQFGKAGNIAETMKWNELLSDVCTLYPMAKSQTSSTKYAMSKVCPMSYRSILPTEPITQSEMAQIDALMDKYRDAM